jgi:hypothetical protein
MKWGSITWILLHSISVQIHERHYAMVRHELFRLIVNLCNALPCPDCTEHASAYLRNIQCPSTKQDFKVMLLSFHNVVNMRLRKPLYKFSDLEKYKTVNLKMCVPQFCTILLNQPYNPRFAMNKLATKSAVNQLHLWLGVHRFI